MGVLYLIPDLNNIEKSCILVEEQDGHFEYNDFYNPDLLEDKERIKKIINQYKSIGRNRKEDILHGAFFDVTIFSSDNRIKEISRLRVEQSLNIGVDLGVKAVVFHTNYIPNFTLESYQMGWLSQNEEFWREMLIKYTSLEIYIENMFDITPYLLARLGERMKSEKRFGICFDYAHSALTQTPQKEWMKALSPYIKHIHLNDNNLLSDLHENIGMGKIDWSQYKKLLELYRIKPTILIEVKGYENQKKCIEYMIQNRMYPFI